MSLRIPYFRKGAKHTSREERLSPSERHKKNKKTSDLTRGGNSDYTAHHSIIPVFTVVTLASKNNALLLS